MTAHRFPVVPLGYVDHTTKDVVNAVNLAGAITLLRLANRRPRRERPNAC
ncbi:hypothetical protein [Polymorphospora sp. NPDC050346]